MFDSAITEAEQLFILVADPKQKEMGSLDPAQYCFLLVGNYAHKTFPTTPNK